MLARRHAHRSATREPSLPHSEEERDDEEGEVVFLLLATTKSELVVCMLGSKSTWQTFHEGSAWG